MSKTLAAIFSALVLSTTAAIAHADDDSTTTVKAHAAALDQLAAQARTDSTAAMARDLSERGDRTAPVVTSEEDFDVQRLSQAAVQSVVGAHVDEVQSCYEHVAGKSKTAAGSVSLSFTVEPSGKVTAIAIDAPGVNAKMLSRCIVQRVKKWKFPAADAETPVEIPFVFSGLQ